MSNSRILSKIPSDLANTANGKLLVVENGEIVWQENYAWERANAVSIPFFTYDNNSNNINLTSDDKLPFYLYSGESSNVSLIKV